MPFFAFMLKGVPKEITVGYQLKLIVSSRSGTKTDIHSEMLLSSIKVAIQLVIYAWHEYRKSTLSVLFPVHKNVCFSHLNDWHWHQRELKNGTR
jgi:hypothetical protein